MTTPICRCRVLYLGSSVPHITKDGLQGIQEPLKDLYPEQGSFSAKGIDSWLSVWSNGLLLENVDESMRQVTRFFNIETLHYCAAVRYVVVPGNNGERVEKFLPLDSPFARHGDPNHAPLFACILRRTAGIKVLECHAFICKKEAAANALVRCCFHSYADSMQAKHLEESSLYFENKRSRSMSAGLNTLEKVEVWRSNAEPVINGSNMNTMTKPLDNNKTSSSSNMSNIDSNDQDNDNYKVWTGVAPTERELLYVDASGTMRSLKSGNATTRSAQVKVRQMVGPPARPPPPPSPSLINGNREQQKQKTMKPSKSKNKKKQKDMPANGIGPPLNGYRPASAIDHFPVMIPPQGVYGRSGLYTERRARRVGRPTLPLHEEPIYIPSTRPLSPVSSYQPAAFPYEQYFMQYGTSPRNKAFKEAKKRNQQHLIAHEYQPLCYPPQIYQNRLLTQDRKYNGSVIPVYRDVRPNDGSMFNAGSYKPPRKNHHHPDDPNHHREDDSDSSPFNTGIYKKGHHHHPNDPKDDDSDPDSNFNPGIYKMSRANGKQNHGTTKEGESDPDSPFNTGIYKKKGHLNERAFSYSIRQEHRSRSNSLANLQFFENGEGGSTLGGRDEDRKERELAQLVSALELKQNGNSMTKDRMDSNFMRKKMPAY